MKKIIFFVTFSVLIFSLSSNNLFAGGGKVRGDKGVGEVIQQHKNIQHPWLFEE